MCDICLFSFARRQHLFSVVRDRLQDGAERLETDGHVEQVRGVEEIVEVAQQREHEIPGDVQERLRARK